MFIGQKVYSVSAEIHRRKKHYWLHMLATVEDKGVVI